MRQEGRYDHQDDERQSEEEKDKWRRDDPENHRDGHSKDTDDKHGPCRDHRTTFIREIRRALHQVEVMSEVGGSWNVCLFRTKRCSSRTCQ